MGLRLLWAGSSGTRLETDSHLITRVTRQTEEQGCWCSRRAWRPAPHVHSANILLAKKGHVVNFLISGQGSSPSHRGRGHGARAGHTAIQNPIVSCPAEGA